MTGIDLDAVVDITMTLAIIYLIGSILRYGQQFITTTITQKAAKGLCTDINQKINKLPLRYFYRATNEKNSKEEPRNRQIRQSRRIQQNQLIRQTRKHQHNLQQQSLTKPTTQTIKKTTTSTSKTKKKTTTDNSVEKTSEKSTNVKTSTTKSNSDNTPNTGSKDNKNLPLAFLITFVLGINAVYFSFRRRKLKGKKAE